jgi:2-dehydropantoate 2-reductase
MAIDHVVVLGAGAIGSLYAAKLAARCDVTAIARPNHAAAITRDGLRVTGVETFTARMKAAAALDAIQPRTLVLVTTKVNDNAAAASAIAPLLRDDTIVLCVQNGLGGDTIVRSAIAQQTGQPVPVLRAVTQCGAIFRDPGVVDYKVAGQTSIEQHARSGEIAALLTASGLDARVSDAIAIDVWRKLIFNCVINPITAIIAVDVGTIADPRLDPLKRLVIDECLAVAHAEGVRLAIDFMRELVEVFGPSRNIASMRQDLMKGRTTEIDHMNGAVVAAGLRHGVGCPVNAALVAIIKAMEGKIPPA